MRADLVPYALPYEVQFLAEIGQALREHVQLGSAAAGAVGAAPRRGGFEHLVQPGHRAEVSGEDRGEQLLELLGRGVGETVSVGGRCADAWAGGRGADLSGSAACLRRG
ncbi:hypothetical protein [Streptomyces boluensis]|uniref:Uncharacterized protein n=1 Tax=Streptomyces boluensis TaxID=1775135 RepID=A0A964US36_9ACTN|nr:hypothetical protein [Streptomyces boluensis]NBE51977.1 hypothetical protein [Streptomyces boluensis]